MIVLSRVKQALSEFVKVLRFGTSDVQTADQYLPFGIDSKPIKNTLAAHAKTANSEDAIILGYLIQSEETEEGETRIYSVDAAGVTQFYIKLFKTGICEIGGNADFMVRFNALDTALQAYKDRVNAELTKIQTAITSLGGTYTKVNTSIDISGAKIEEIKTL